MKKLLEDQKEKALKITEDKVNALDFWSGVKVPDGANASFEPFPTDTKVYHFHPNAFIEQMRRLRPCSCPIDEPLFKCNKYKSNYGPVYFGSTKGKNYLGWNKLLANNKVTENEKLVISVMSENEGYLESIQSYDNQVLSFGFMQKTINSSGKGEFTDQIHEFKKDNPRKYIKLFLNCGWSVEENDSGEKILFYTSKDHARNITGIELKNEIRKKYNAENENSMMPCEALSHLIKVGTDVDFQEKQVLDFVSRLRNYMNKKIDTYKICDYIKSPLGIGTILDHSVNRPAHVYAYFKEALRQFYTKKDAEVKKYNEDKENKVKKELISRNPNTWSINHSFYEKEILDIYGPLRGTIFNTTIKGKPMTDATERYKHLKKKL